MSVCQNIKAVVEAREISIKELSRKLNIPYTTLYNMLNRDSERFDLNLLEQIAQALDVSVGILMGSAVPNMERILCDHYPSRNEYLARRTPMKTIRTIPKGTTIFRLIQAIKDTTPCANSTS